MKYRYFSLAAMMALALTLSCVKEEPTDEPAGPSAGETDKPEVLPPLNEGEIAFRATGEFFYEEDSDNTDGVMSCFEDGTTASVFTVGYEAPVEVEAVNTQTNAYFVAAAEASKTYYAVYPSSVPHSFEAREQGVYMSVTIPNEQDGTLSSASISVASSSGNDARMDFRNICGVLKFSTTSQSIKSVTFSGASGEDLIGTVTVNGFDQETGEPIFGGISQAKSEVKLNIEGRKGVFYVALLPGLVLENGFQASFEMMPEEEEMESARSSYAMTLTRSGCRDLGNILDYIPQLNWFVTPSGAGEKDGKSWESAISGEQMFQMLACNRPDESGKGNTTTDITSEANKETFADYLKVHNTKHALQLDGVTFHIAQGEYSTQNYVRVSFPELERKVRITLCGGYDSGSTGKDLSARDIAQYQTVIKAPSGSGTARMFFFQRWLDMTLEGLTFTGGMGDSSIGGGAILLNETSTSSILFKDCTFTKNNSASFGGAVTGANEVGEISFVGCSFSDNSAAKSGGAVRITGGTWNFTECSFSGNKGTADDSFGGALYVKEASLECRDCEFFENSSVNNGGAVWLNAMSKADFIDCDFTSNVCTKNLAGAICLSGANPLNITGGIFRENSAPNGGCIYNNAASTINIRGTKFIDNKATTGVGGVFYCNTAAGPMINIADAEFNGNTATAEGSAILFRNGTWTVTNTAFNNNTSVSNGGAIYAHTGSLTLTGGSFSGNKTTSGSVGGGAIYVTTNAKLTVDGTTFSENSAQKTGSTGAGKGGAICIANSAAASHTIKNATFTANTDALAGGALFIEKMAVEIDDCTFDGNSANGHGGAVYATGAATFTIKNSKFEENILNADFAGGAIYSNSTSTGNLISFTKFTSNSTKGNGGALYWSGTGKLAIDKCSFDGNYSKAQGAVIKKTQGTLYFNASSFTSNDSQAERTGGVLRLEGGDTFISNSCFYGNATTLAQTDIVVTGGTTTVLNSTLFESDKTMACVRVYNAKAVVNLYNNVLLNPNTSSNEGTVRVGYWGNPGSITSPGYNYTTAWKTLVNSGVAGSITMAGTDKVVAYNDVSGNFTSTSTTDGRGYYTWTKPSDVAGTTSASVTTFLNGITGGSDFAAWLGTVNGLTQDIAGNNRSEAGWYPGCYQGN